MSVAEQRYRAVLSVISDGMTVKDAAARQGVSRQTMHAWLAKYEAGGLEALADGSHRPHGCPHQMGAELEAAVAEMRRAHVGWGPRRIGYELARRGAAPAPSESAIYRCLVRLGADRARYAPAATAGLEAVGARVPDGAVADGHRRRVPARRRRRRQGPDRGR